MRRNVPVLLADALAAVESIRAMASQTSREEYLATRMVRSAVERELLIIGEALNALDDRSDDARGRVTHLGRIIGMRNRLAHTYDLIDDEMVWSIAIEDIPRLETELRTWSDGLT